MSETTAAAHNVAADVEQRRQAQTQTSRRVPNPPPVCHPLDVIDAIFPHLPRAKLRRAEADAADAAPGTTVTSATPTAATRQRKSLLPLTELCPSFAPFLVTKTLVASLYAGIARLVSPNAVTVVAAAAAAASASASAGGSASTSASAQPATQPSGTHGRFHGRSDVPPACASWPSELWLALALRALCNDANPAFAGTAAAALPSPDCECPDLRNAVIYVPPPAAAAAADGDSSIHWRPADLIGPVPPAAAAAGAVTAAADTDAAATSEPAPVTGFTAQTTAAAGGHIDFSAAAALAAATATVPSWARWGARLVNTSADTGATAAAAAASVPTCVSVPTGGWLLVHPGVRTVVLADAAEIRDVSKGLCSRARGLYYTEPYILAQADSPADADAAAGAVASVSAAAAAKVAAQASKGTAGRGAALGSAAAEAQDSFERASKRTWIEAAPGPTSAAASSSDVAAATVASTSGDAASMDSVAAAAAADAHGAFGGFCFSVPPSVLARLSRSKCCDGSKCSNGPTTPANKNVHLYCPDCKVPALPPAEVTPVLRAAAAELAAASAPADGRISSAGGEETDGTTAAPAPATADGGDRKRRRIAPTDAGATADGEAAPTAAGTDDDESPGVSSSLCDSPFWPYRHALLRLFGPPRAAGRPPRTLLAPGALPVCVTLVHHRQERIAKSTGLHGCVVSDGQFELVEFPAEVPEFDPSTTVVLYPSADAVAIDADVEATDAATAATAATATAPPAAAATATAAATASAPASAPGESAAAGGSARLQEDHGYSCRAPIVQLEQQAADRAIDWPRVTRLVLLEATWQKAPGMILHPHLQHLPRVKLRPRVSTFWRHQELGAAYLSTCEAAYYACVELRERALRHSAAAADSTADAAEQQQQQAPHPAARAGSPRHAQYSGEFDDLLLLYASRHARVVNEYKGASGKKVLTVWRASVDEKLKIQQQEAEKAE